MRRGDESMLDETEIDRLAREQDLTLGFREAARRALAFARRYRVEEGAAGGARELACIAQAQVWRRAVRDLHAGLPVPALPDHPGLARAAAATATATTDGRQTG